MELDNKIDKKLYVFVAARNIYFTMLPDIFYY